MMSVTVRGRGFVYRLTRPVKVSAIESETPSRAGLGEVRACTLRRAARHPLHARLRRRRTMPADVYRGSTLGKALAASLDELIASQDIPASMREQVMRLYDAAMCEQLKDGQLQVRGKADQLHGRIEDGKLETYRFVNGNWTFDMKQARLKGHAFNSSHSSGFVNRDGRVIENLHVAAVDEKQAALEQAPIEEAPLQLAASGDADEANAAATTADDDADDGLYQYDGASDPREPSSKPARRLSEDRWRR